MSLTPQFLDELKDRVGLADLVGRRVTWDMKKSNQAKGDWWAPCPFHTEKTASFHVDDRKGFYYCFGCGEKGGAIDFVKSTENVGFIEAVEKLCQIAGMQMPARDPRAADAAKKRASLSEVMEFAVRFYRMQWGGARAAQARGYIQTRGLTEDTIARFEIGFAPDAPHDLRDFLQKQDVTEAQMIAAGLIYEEGDKRDRMTNRIIFPIRDARGRCISFGGRAMSPHAKAKYLNGPETELFKKSHSLYNLQMAREAAPKAGTIIVAEGYMDVIALAQGGFEHAVAPLGTAVTLDQLRMLWKITPEPVLALDGDQAGLRAAYRALDLALPQIAAHQTLRFVMLPSGKDPDDVLRESGAAHMQEVLNGSLPMIDLIWERALKEHRIDSPERRANFELALEATLRKVQDERLRRHYTEALFDRKRSLFWDERKKQNPRSQPAAATPSAKNSQLVQMMSLPFGRRHIPECALLSAFEKHRTLVTQYEDRLERVRFGTGELAKIGSILLRGEPLPADMQIPKIDIVELHPHLQGLPPGDRMIAALDECIARLLFEQSWEREYQDAHDELLGDQHTGLDWRVRETIRARGSYHQGGSDLDDMYATDETAEDRKAIAGFLADEIWKKDR